ncbi:flagellar hook assembly protein FlgD [Priestia megaterium]|nr:flagellar hook assembly protein FlgD [Priestia megaterium]
MTNPIDSSLYLSNNPPQQKQTGTNILGKDDFLRILITQLQNQDPMNPMEDKDFIAQMAQFSTLEQMTNMSKSIESFLQEIQNESPILKGSELIGKKVAWLDEKGNQHQAVVETVSIKDGTMTFTLNDEQKTSLLLNDIIQVSN